MKKMLATMISAAMLLAPISSYAQYPDVPDGAWYEEYLTELAGKNAIKGYEDGTFRPDKEVTEAEFIKTIISLTVGEPEADGAEGEHWSQKYISAAADAKLFEDETKIRHDEPITRAFMAELLSNATVNILEEDKIEDVTAASALSDWTDDEYIAQCYCKGIIGGYEDGEFKPDNKMTRAEMCAVLIRLMDESQRLENVEPTPEPTVEPTAEPAEVHVNYLVQKDNSELTEQVSYTIDEAGEMEINPANLKLSGYKAVGYSVDGNEAEVIIGTNMPLKLDVTGERDHNVTFYYDKFPESFFNPHYVFKTITWYDKASHSINKDGKVIKCTHEVKLWVEMEPKGFGLKGPDGKATILSGQPLEFGDSKVILKAECEVGNGNSGNCNAKYLNREIDMPAYQIYPPTVTAKLPFVTTSEDGIKQPSEIGFVCIDDSPMVFEGTSMTKEYLYQMHIPEEQRIAGENKIATSPSLAGSDDSYEVGGFFPTTERGIRYEVELKYSGGGLINTGWEHSNEVAFWSIGSIEDK